MDCCKKTNHKRLTVACAIGLLLSAACVTAGAAEPQRLTRDGRLKFSPLFVAGGAEIVYCVHGDPKRVAMTRLKLSDGSQQLIDAASSASEFDPDFSRDGRYYCFARSGRFRQLSLIIKDTRSDTEAVFHPPGALRSTIRTPRFLPGGSRVIFTLSAPPSGLQIASVNLQGKDLKMLTASNGTNAWPAVSPDGKTIVFSSSRAGSYDLYLMDADGSNVRRLTRTPSREIHAAFSPDGKRIAFTSSRDGNYEIYIMRSDGSHLARLTAHPERDDYPTWHPDGKRLLTVSERNGDLDLYLFELREFQSLRGSGN